MKRLLTQVGCALLFLEVVYLMVMYHRSNAVPVYQSLNSSPDSAHEQEQVSAIIQDFLHNIRTLHPSKGASNVPSLLKEYDIDVTHLEASEPVTIDWLSQFLTVPPEWRRILQWQHEKVVKNIPKPPKKALKGQGVVLTGGGKLFGQALVGIRWILEYHPGLPIELWMAKDEYEPEYCENIFPALNVSCIVMEDFFGDLVKDFDYMGYPLKSLALAGSQFRDVYFMDVDSFPLGPIKELFDSAPYRETGFISWPDYWLRLTAPDYYEIAGSINLEFVNRKEDIFNITGTVPERISSETGQIVFDKLRHWDSILLAAYYNLNGKEFYYPLLSQSPTIPGFGDKETFISAASVLGHSVYQVKEGVRTLGYHQTGGAEGYHGSGMLQRDPVADYNVHVLGKKQPVGGWALHCNNMKLDPFFLFSDQEDTHWNKPNQEKNPRRSLGEKKDVVRDIGYDVELRLYEVVQNVLCDWVLHHEPRHSNNEDPKRTCERAMYHVDWLKANA